MLKSFLLITFRNVLKNKGASYQNILCLTLGAATCIFIFNYISFELSYDIPAGETTVYRVETRVSGGNEAGYTDALSSIAAGRQLKGKFPKLNFTRLIPFSEEGVAHLLYQRDSTEQRVYLERVYHAESSIFTTLPVTLVDGDEASALRPPNAILLSLATAKRIFREEYANGISILGKELKPGGATGGVSNEPYVVTGIFSDLPANTHLKFDALVAGRMFNAAGDSSPKRNTYTYVSIPRDRTTVDALREGVVTLITGERLYLRPADKIHLASNVSNNPEPGANAGLLLFLALIGVIVMLLAISNYTNNTLLNSFSRAKEIGIRKLLGIQPRQLITTFIGEAFIINCLAGMLAVVFYLQGINLAMWFGKADETSSIIKPIDHQSIGEQNLLANLMFLSCVVLVSTLLSSIYPALHFNSLKPVDLMRGKLQLAGSKLVGGASRVVRGLLVFQICISVLFLSGVYIVVSQLRHMENHDSQPFELSITGVFPGSASGGSPLFVVNALDRLDELMRRGIIKKVDFSNLYDGEIKSRGRVQIKKVGTIGIDSVSGSTTMQVVDHTFWNNKGPAMVAGRAFDKRFGHDSRKMIVNEAALGNLGVEDADSLLEKKVLTSAGWFDVIGVANDSSTEPRVYTTGFGYRTYLRLTLEYPGKAGESLQEFLQRAEIELSSPFPFFSLFRRRYNDQQFVEANLLNMFLFFTGLAILIANMGMFGLASFITQKRVREIGLRKILGATTVHTMLVLMADFLKLVLVGALIAVPFVVLGADFWLEDYHARISITPHLIVLPVLIILLVSMLVVAEKCWKAALTSPIKALDDQ